MVYSIFAPALPRFDGEFGLSWSGGQGEPADGARYVLVLAEVMSRLAWEYGQDPAGSEPSDKSRRDARIEVHIATRDALKKDAEAFVGKLDANEAAIFAAILLGRHNETLDRLEGTLFRSALILDDEDDKSAVDVEITITKGLPPPQHEPTSAQQSLFADIAAALTVIKTVYQTNYADRSRTSDKARRKRDQRWARLRLDKYVRDLKGIADVGLKDGFVDMAALSLKSLKAEFVSMEAPRIKNDYVWNLGRWSAGFALLALAVSLLSFGTVPELVFLKPFAIASVGAAIGTWLSFSIRRVSLSFEQLAVPEEDMLHPASRLLFVLGLTLVVMLIFYNGVMNLQIGDLNTTLLDGIPGKPDGQTGKVPSLPAISLLVGLFCGIAERGLSSAVSLRATDFASSIGGNKRTS